MIGIRSIGNHTTKHKVVHIIYKIRIFIDIHWVQIKLIATPCLAHLTHSKCPLVIYMETSIEHVGSRSQVVQLHRSCRTIQAMTKTIEDTIGNITSYFQAQLTSLKFGCHICSFCFLSIKAGLEVKVHIESLINRVNTLWRSYRYGLCLLDLLQFSL